MDPAALLTRIEHQESRIVLATFDDDDAWTLGSMLRSFAQEQRAPVVIDIRRFDRPLFYAALPGSTPHNVEWVRRKSNTVTRFHRSSYAVGLHLQKQGKTLAEKYDLDPAEYVAHGGSFPLKLDGSGVIGTVTVSGLPQQDDHMLVVRGLCLLGSKNFREFQLPPADSI